IAFSSLSMFSNLSLNKLDLCNITFSISKGINAPSVSKNNVFNFLNSISSESTFKSISPLKLNFETIVPRKKQSCLFIVQKYVKKLFILQQQVFLQQQALLQQQVLLQQQAFLQQQVLLQQ